MAQKFEITAYYELLALYRALHVVKFAWEPLIPELPGSPFLAAVANRVVETLAQMEIARGRPESANGWQMKIDENGEVWRIAVNNAVIKPDQWNRMTHQQKKDMAHICLSPFIFTEEMVEDFIRQADDQAKKQSEQLQTETDKGLWLAYANALGQMGALESIDTLFTILNSTENEGARLELSLWIARLTGHKQPFVRLLRQSRYDKGTAISQTIFDLGRQFTEPDMKTLARDAAAAFGRNDFAAGVPLLSQLIGQVPKTQCTEVATIILNQCEKALRELGPPHVEYVILALHTLEVAA